MQSTSYFLFTAFRLIFIYTKLSKEDFLILINQRILKLTTLHILILYRKQSYSTTRTFGIINYGMFLKCTNSKVL